MSSTTFVPEIMDEWVKMTAFTDTKVSEMMLHLGAPGPTIAWEALSLQFRNKHWHIMLYPVICNGGLCGSSLPLCHALSVVLQPQPS